MKNLLLFLFICSFFFQYSFAQQSSKPVRMAMMGLSHGHSPWIFNRKDKTDVELVGIYELDAALAASYAKRYNLDQKLFFTDAKAMLDATKPEAVLAFGSIYAHLEAVELAAPRGIHVMVEKPLTYSLDQAKKMEALAKKHGIHLLTNFETSWYASTEKTYQLLQDKEAFGPIRKAVFHHGHRGPKEIGVGKEFLDWLTDPVQNGGGALIDFGCYGANIMTYLMEGRKPISVTAITNTYKPDIYPKVDDEATIILDYGDAQAIIQASWNWPFDRKDMEVYGKTGQVISENRSKMRTRIWDIPEEKTFEVQPEEVGVYVDPFSYFADVIRGKIKVEDYNLYSLNNNMIVAEILDAARKSTEKGETVFLGK
ncbi:Gfo/Idh/MocA family protein [Aquiflexum gelatinilyticum]|uniref:Gfo/Idh/MocA family oxidoreductase n=1 Tax=Aquiflexum gelatinilyticum TaxID=2961943 RepID=A0A9X2P3T3_9BACT|nr:Gfo/Idh/MocA family oxidoreductase [Aquiflexum gelatinilyticum]MCR9014662.1 Gfo/Idh/MocA family oxidoreductase [Aquiflexum gelatinilyticum]